MTEFDYIIIGAGSAGCVLAERLTANGKLTALVIEAGASRGNFLLEMPTGFIRLGAASPHRWMYQIEPELGNAQRAEVWPRGRVVGGSSSVNGMIYNRGRRDDYEELGSVAGPLWNWASMLPYLRDAEDHSLGANEVRGVGGPLGITMPPHHPYFDALIAAGPQVGLKPTEDVNDASADEVIGYAPWTIRGGVRCSAYTAFLAPSLARSNLTVMSSTRVDRIIVEARVAKGVICTGDHAGHYFARRDVILSAGAIATPQLLMLSGIGDAEKLRALGLDVIQHVPEIGRDLVEHRTMTMRFRARVGASINSSYMGARLYANLARFVLRRDGPMAYAPFCVAAFPRILEESRRADAEILFANYSLDPKAVPRSVEKEPGVNCVFFPLRPTSKGCIELRSPNPAVPPIIRPNYLSTSADRKIAIGLVRRVRELFRQNSLAGYVRSEVFPTAGVESDQDLLDVWRESGGCGYHAIGTCRMGTDEAAPVDTNLRLRAVRNLRVMDCSVLPMMVAGNTNAPIMAMAARGADLMLEEKH